jgi:hypothetical protein
VPAAAGSVFIGGLAPGAFRRRSQAQGPRERSCPPCGPLRSHNIFAAEPLDLESPLPATGGSPLGQAQNSLPGTAGTQPERDSTVLSTQITVEGNVASDIQLRNTPNGTPVVEVVVLANSGRRINGEYQPDEPTRIRVTAGTGSPKTSPPAPPPVTAW